MVRFQEKCHETDGILLECWALCIQKLNKIILRVSIVLWALGIGEIALAYLTQKRCKLIYGIKVLAI